MRYYTELFRGGNERMGLQPGIVRTDAQGRSVTSFFFWLACAAGADRPGKSYTYTANWPYDPLAGNHPLPDALIWSIVSVILLVLGIAGAIFLYQRYIRDEDYLPRPVTELAEPSPTASQKAILAYFLAAAALLVVQVGLAP